MKPTRPEAFCTLIPSRPEKAKGLMVPQEDPQKGLWESLQQTGTRPSRARPRGTDLGLDEMREAQSLLGRTLGAVMLPFFPGTAREKGAKPRSDGN